MLLINLLRNWCHVFHSNCGIFLSHQRGTCPGWVLSTWHKARHAWEVGNLNSENTSVRLAYRQVCGAFFWLMIDVGGSIPVWIVPPREEVQTCTREQGSKQLSFTVSASVQPSGCCLSSAGTPSVMDCHLKAVGQWTLSSPVAFGYGVLAQREESNQDNTITRILSLTLAQWSGCKTD